MPSRPSKGPLSIQGAGKVQAASEAPTLRLRIADAVGTSASGPCLVHPSSCAAWAQHMQPTCHAVRAGGSDCVALVRADEGATSGCLHVDTPLQHSLHLCSGESYDFRLFTAPSDEPFALTNLEAEVRLLDPGRVPGGLQVDERQLAQALVRQLLGQVLAVGQLLVVRWRGADVVARVTTTNTLDAAAQEEAVAYHCFRGLLVPDTAVLLDTAQPPASNAANGGEPTAAAALQPFPEVAQLSLEDADPAGGAAASQPGASSGGDSNGGSSSYASGHLVLLNRQTRVSREPSASIVNVFTNDGEVFPVKRKLLRSCIALTAAVRSNEQHVISLTINVDTLTFDRVLIFLEAQALGRPPPDYAVHLAEPLLAAASTLGLRTLEVPDFLNKMYRPLAEDGRSLTPIGVATAPAEPALQCAWWMRNRWHESGLAPVEGLHAADQEMCEAKLGQSRGRLRLYSFEEVQAANAAGNCWLILDGMVLDVTRWLPEHPGGSTIIPAQALNLDCARFFEVYHVSRESFLYLKEFYVGEIAAEDAELVPCQEQPSSDFMQQLREYTPFRMHVEHKAFKSF